MSCPNVVGLVQCFAILDGGGKMFRRIQCMTSTFFSAITSLRLPSSFAQPVLRSAPFRHDRIVTSVAAFSSSHRTAAMVLSRMTVPTNPTTGISMAQAHSRGNRRSSRRCPCCRSRRRRCSPAGIACHARAAARSRRRRPRNRRSAWLRHRAAANAHNPPALVAFSRATVVADRIAASGPSKAASASPEVAGRDALLRPGPRRHREKEKDLKSRPSVNAAWPISTKRITSTRMSHSLPWKNTPTSIHSDDGHPSPP